MTERRRFFLRRLFFMVCGLPNQERRLLFSSFPHLRNQPLILSLRNTLGHLHRRGILFLSMESIILRQPNLCQFMRLRIYNFSPKKSVQSV